MKKFFAIFFVVLLTNGISGADRMCGPKLTEIMWAVCENGFNEMFRKHTDPSQSEALQRVLPAAIKRDVPYPYAASSLSSIFQLEAGNLMAKTRRIRMMGIADECCKKSCTFNELLAYCN